jgi:hypothetical protein
LGTLGAINIELLWSEETISLLSSEDSLGQFLNAHMKNKPLKSILLLAILLLALLFSATNILAQQPEKTVADYVAAGLTA